MNQEKMEGTKAHKQAKRKKQARTQARTKKKRRRNRHTSRKTEMHRPAPRQEPKGGGRETQKGQIGGVAKPFGVESLVDLGLEGAP